MNDIDGQRDQFRYLSFSDKGEQAYYFRMPLSRLGLKSSSNLVRTAGEVSMGRHYRSRVELYRSFPPEMIRVTLSDRYRLRLIESACRLAGSISKLAELIDTSPSSVCRYRDGTRTTPCLFLRRLSEFFENRIRCKCWGEIRNHVNSFKLGTKGSSSLIKIRAGKEIFDFENIDGARITAAILGDGHLGERVASYINPEATLRRKVDESIQRVIGDAPIRIYRNKEARYPQALAMILRKIGLRPGPKVFTNPEVPDWVKEVDDVNIPRVFLRQFFSDEANVSEEKCTISLSQSVDITALSPEIKNKLIAKRLHKIDYIRFAPRRLSDIIEMLRERFNIEANGPYPVAYYRATKKCLKGERLKWRLSFSGKAYLEKFEREIGFDLDYKQEALRNCIRKIKIYQAKNGLGLSGALRAAAKVESTQNKITSSLLAKEMRHGRRTSQKWLRKLAESGLVEEVSGGERKNKSLGRSPIIYKLTNRAKGWFMCARSA